MRKLPSSCRLSRRSVPRNARAIATAIVPIPSPLCVGTLTLRVPRQRNGRFSTELFARYQRSEQALLLAMVEMVIQGVSTRKITAMTEELCGAEFSKSTVSELCKNLDPIVDAWNGRSLREHPYPFL